MGEGELPLRGNSLFLSKGAFFSPFFLFKRERDSLVFQPVHAHSGPWKETKGSQGQARLENEGRVIDQTGELQLQRGNVGRRGGEGRGGGRLSGNTHAEADTGAPADVYTGTQRNTQRIIMAPSEGERRQIFTYRNHN